MGLPLIFVTSFDKIIKRNWSSKFYRLLPTAYSYFITKFAISQAKIMCKILNFFHIDEKALVVPPDCFTKSRRALPVNSSEQNKSITVRSQQIYVTDFNIALRHVSYLHQFV